MEEGAPAAKRVKTECEDSPEVKAGIMRYVHPEVPGFFGILKDRYSDFLVNEVDLDGKVVHLTDVETLPKEDTVTEEKTEMESVDPRARMLEIVGDEGKVDDFMGFVKDCRENGGDGKEFVFEGIAEKEKRSALHVAVREGFAGFDSMTKDGAIVVRMGEIKTYTHRVWKGKPDYVRFAVYKENIDTLAAMQVIAKKLGVKPANVGNAGNKDKRGITCQYMTAYRVEAARLAKLNGELRGIMIGNFEYVKDQVSLGDLFGNRFHLAIRDIDASEEHVRAAVESLTKDGFINYFGLQRFGTGSVPTQSVGIALLKEEWKEAAHLIMSSQGKASPAAAQARDLFEKGEYQRCLNTMPRFMHIESSLVRGLMKSGGKNFKAALDFLPRTTRMLYLHAYQSYVWNSMASLRIEKFGFQPVLGDLVMDGDSVKALTEEDIASGKFAMTDVVLPLPGSDSRFPENEMRAAFLEFMAKDGVTMDMITSNRGLFCLKGDYRNILEIPRDVEWHIRAYLDPKEALLETDATRLRGTPLPPEPTEEDATKAGVPLRRALCIAFTLRSSCYATMCYRELLKQCSSAEYQTQMHKEVNAEE